MQTPVNSFKLVPMVDTPAQAAEIVRFMRYPPGGVRGMGGARAARWGRYPAYAREANDQVCLLMQAEMEIGATFVAVGLDTRLLARATHALAAKFKTSVAELPASKTY